MRKDLRKLGLLLKVLGIVDKFDPQNLQSYYFISDDFGNVSEVITYNLKDEGDLVDLLHQLTTRKVDDLIDEIVLRILETVDTVSYRYNFDAFVWNEFPDERAERAEKIKQKIKNKILDIIKPFKTLEG